MTQFVIRSMSTTDMGPGVDPVPYHIYLLPVEQRTHAWWGAAHRAAKFDTHEDAVNELSRYGIRKSGAQVVPEDATAQGLPAYWDR